MRRMPQRHAHGQRRTPQQASGAEAVAVLAVCTWNAVRRSTKRWSDFAAPSLVLLARLPVRLPRPSRREARFFVKAHPVLALQCRITWCTAARHSYRRRECGAGAAGHRLARPHATSRRDADSSCRQKSTARSAMDVARAPTRARASELTGPVGDRWAEPGADPGAPSAAPDAPSLPVFLRQRGAACDARQRDGTSSAVYAAGPDAGADASLPVRCGFPTSTHAAAGTSHSGGIGCAWLTALC